MASRVATVVDEDLGQLFSMGYGEIYQSVEGFSSRVPKRYPLVESLSSQVQKIYQSVERFSSRVRKMYSLVERLSSRVENRDRMVALGPDARRAGAHTPITGTGCRDDYPQKKSKRRTVYQFDLNSREVGFSKVLPSSAP